jgi:hypothetical protein
MPVVPELKRDSTTAIKMKTLIGRGGMIRIPGGKPIRWVKKNPTVSDYMICTVMYGSGQRMTGTTIIMVRLIMGVHG